MKFLVFGSINNDSFFNVDHIVRGGETISSGGFSKNAGGKGANQAAAMGKAGVAVDFVCKCGEDGKWILELLERYGVNTALSIVSPETTTGQAIIQIDRAGQNSIILEPGGNHEFTLNEAEEILSNFTEGDVIILQNEINITRELIGLAHEKGMKVVLNPSPFDERISSFDLDKVDFFFVNELESADLLGIASVPTSDDEFRKVAEELSLKYEHSSIILTAGANGAWYAKGGNAVFAPTVEAEVVDTTGAGDTFCGYFMSSFSKDGNAEKALNYASAAASIAVSRHGAMAAMPYSKEVSQYLDRG